MHSKKRAAWRERLYDVIFEADTRAGQLFDIGLLIAILLSVTAICLETVAGVQKQYGSRLNTAEWIFTCLFSIEYILRLIAVRRPLNYAFSFYGIIDLVSILPAYTVLLGLGGTRSFAVVRSFRLLRVFRILKLIHLTSESEDLGAAVWKARGKIVVFLSVVLITVTIAGTLMYEIEGAGSSSETESSSNEPQPSSEELQETSEETQFTSIPQSIYWAVVTMTTVGYGDIVPQTPQGKIVSAILILVGYSLIIVPTGFVSAEIIDSKISTGISNQTCPYCMAEGHLRDAQFCRKCGKPL